MLIACTYYIAQNNQSKVKSNKSNKSSHSMIHTFPKTHSNSLFTFAYKKHKNHKK